MSDAISRVVIGMDPHKRSVAIEMMSGDETVLGGGRYAKDRTGFTAMRRYVSQFPRPPRRAARRARRPVRPDR